VVGIVGDVHQLGIVSNLTSEIYLPFSQVPAPILCFAIRTAEHPSQLANAAKRAIWQIDPDQAVSYLMPMSDLASESLAPERVLTLLLGLFAAMALIMALMGIYGVVGFAAAQRTREIGVRLALGARYSDVLKNITAQALSPIAAGLIFGLAGSFAAMRLISSVLYGVRPADPAVFVTASVALVSCAVLASYIPARRAAQVDPVVALRDE
jgi:putative ABC transport system permease protein